MVDYRDVAVEEEDSNERESLELITQMIRNTKCRAAENTGMSFLLQGYVTVAVPLLVWFMLKQTGNADWNCLQFLLPLVAFPDILWSGRKRKKMVRIYVDRTIGYVWTVFGLSAFLSSYVAVFGWDIPTLFTILLFMGMGTALTGLAVGMKVVTVGGVLRVLLPLGCFFISGISRTLFFTLVFVFMMVIPGYATNRVASRNKEGIAYVQGTKSFTSL